MTTVAPAPGEVIGDYEILERIGGNMGLVYKAHQRRLKKVVALKLIRADSISDPALVARFEREIEVLGQLNHPNLVAAADARRVDGWLLVAMEWIEGLDLSQMVRFHGPLPIADACEAAREAALGLQHCHERGLVHRDIKPANLMLTSDGRIKVIDLGLALPLGDDVQQLTQAGHVMGSLAYCAPEQFRNASTVDIRADIYSLGCTLHHLLTGRSPYWQRKTPTEAMQAHLNEPFPSLREARPDAPAGLHAVVARMTAKDPEARLSTPREVAEALEPFARGADLKKFLPVKFQQSPRPLGTSSPESPTACRKSKAIWLRRAAYLAILLVVGVAVFLAVNPRRTSEEALVAAGFAPARHPVVVLVDTIAPGGIYDEDDRRKGISNTEVLRNSVLRDLPLRAESLNVSVEAYNLEWRGENHVIELKPDLVVIHRSVFFHPLNAVLELGSPPFTNDVLLKKWQTEYRVADDKLINFIAIIGNASRQTRFLVYSTGTDENWRSEEYRKRWKEQIGARFPALKDRIDTMPIPQRADGRKGTFKDANTAGLMRDQVKTILLLPDR